MYRVNYVYSNILTVQMSFNELQCLNIIPPFKNIDLAVQCAM